MSTTCPALSACIGVLNAWDAWDAGDPDGATLAEWLEDWIEPLRDAVASGCPNSSPLSGESLPLSTPSSTLSSVTAAELAEALRQLSSDASRLCCSIDTRVGASVENAEELLLRYDAQQAAQSQECTGVAATWCPRCGDCTCSDHVEFASTPDDKCPLHGLESTHAEEQQADASKPALSEVEKAAVKSVSAYFGIDGEDYDDAMLALRETLRKAGVR